MNIVHNLAALNANRQLDINNKSVSKSMEKLSSGLRITKAADDAAGLAISEKMKAQIRGLEQASRNIQDGVSLVQTAEGGLADIHDQIQRARELTIQAASDTLAPSDRSAIQEEIDQIKKGINHIANNTEFNEISLLNGSNPRSGAVNGGVNSSYNYEGVLSLNVAADGKLDLRTNEGYPTTELDNGKILIYGSGSTSYPQVLINGGTHQLHNNVSQSTTMQNGEFQTVYLVDNVEVTQTARIVEDKYEFSYKIENKSSESKSVGFYFHMDTMLDNDDRAPFMVNNQPVHEEQSYSGATLPEDFIVYNNTGNPDLQVHAVIKGNQIIESPDEFRIGHYSDVGNPLGWTDTNESVGDSGYALKWSERTIPANGSFEVNTFYGLAVPPTVTDPGELNDNEGPYDIIIQTGANAGNNMKIQLSDVRTSSLEIEDIVIDPYARAMEALEKLDSAMQKVSSERSKYGAYQNGLEHALNNVLNSGENLTAAESRIRDVDYAIAGWNIDRA
jgi:flagellin